MDGNISDDYEMECDFIHKPGIPFTNEKDISDEDYMDRPTTPPNNLSAGTSDVCFTPTASVDRPNEPPFIRKCGIYRNLFNRSRCTSTPLQINKLSSTLPSSSLLQLPHLSNTRQCRSAESKIDPDHIPYEYINPFTPDGKMFTLKTDARKQLNSYRRNNPVPKFEINDSFESDGQSNNDSDVELPVRPRLSEFNVFRFNEEFLQLKQIGKGVHGCVFKCLNRMNGCVYAVKKTINPIKSSIQERVIRNEIYAHGVLDHVNVVRNYSCWKEEGFVFIQNEYCNGGSLEEYIQSHVMSEALLRSLLFQMALALRYIHKNGLAHMDIKPGNIFLSIDGKKESSFESDAGFSEDDKVEEIVFKLGDLGHVTKLDEHNDIEEGDCRYLAREILEEKFSHLDRADIFSLGLSVYEVSGAGPLPKNGDEWQELRNGKLKFLKQHSKEFNNILKAMVDPCPEKRPSAAELVKMIKSPPSEDVFDHLQHYRHSNTRLEHKMETTGQVLRVLYKTHKQLQDQLINGKEKASTSGRDKGSLVKKKTGVTKTRVVGRKTMRSSSTIF